MLIPERFVVASNTTWHNNQQDLVFHLLAVLRDELQSDRKPFIASFWYEFTRRGVTQASQAEFTSKNLWSGACGLVQVENFIVRII
jgi:hypothetical protein